jgi:ABC-type glutathione transport system ATPase component
MISAAGLTRSFGSRVVVDRVTLEVGRGEIMALLGPNGAGKTTTGLRSPRKMKRTIISATESIAAAGPRKKRRPDDDGGAALAEALRSSAPGTQHSAPLRLDIAPHTE